MIRRAWGARRCSLVAHIRAWTFWVRAAQLNIERGRGNVFQGFVEPELGFLPTYKYIAGTDDLDQV